MDRKIQIHQVLHGYRNGHQLLASSMEFSFFDRRLLDSMSDGAGIDSMNCKDGYITGYILPESQKYVLAKTWYAHDMSRPGCVWTHSLIFDIDSIYQIKFPGKILEIFHRPFPEKYNEYAESILISQEDNINSVELEKLQYTIYTIYGTDRSRYVEIEDDSYIESLILAVCHMPSRLLANFSFCTNSLINRCIDGKNFSYQMVTKDNIYRVCVNMIEGKLYQQREGVVGSPAWAREYAKAIVLDNLRDIEVFMKIFDEQLLKFSTFNQLLRLYFVTKELDEQYSLFDYYDILKKLSEDDYIFYFESIRNELVHGDYFDDLFLNDFMEMISIAEKSKKKFKKEDKDKLVRKLLDKKINKIPEFLSNYIHGTLGKQGASIAQAIIMQAKPENLKQISNMDHDIVVVAVATNNKLIMSQDIWSLSRNYQCDVINVLDSAITYDELLKILALILKIGKEDISEAVYNKAQDKLVPALLELFHKQTEIQYIEQAYIWDRYLLADQVRLTCNLLQIAQMDIKKHLLLKIDTYNSEIRNAISAHDWVKLLKSCRLESVFEKQDMAIKILPLILGGDEMYPDDIVAFSFVVVHKALAESQIPYEDWSLFENMLPAVELCYSWDKCLRLRKAFENRGYDVNRLFCEFDNMY